MLDLGIKILGALKSLFDMKGSLAKAKAEHRGRMADLFEKIAVCLEQTATEIRHDSYPGGRCQELLTYAVELPAVVKGTIDDAKAQEIAAALQGAHEVERLFGERDKPEGLQQLEALDEAAGTIRALGNLLRV